VDRKVGTGQYTPISR